jgi:catechol 2,3-dioxygenase-like lactoylglutathione lyase family enzyme
VPSRLLALSFDARDPGRLARFWSGVLGREVVDDVRGALLPGSGTQVGLRFTPGRSGKSGPNRMHLHLTSATAEQQELTVASAVELGARHTDVGQLPEELHVVLADPEGNEFCVIEAGNDFLAGCGFLGELACEGTRDVGLFWAEALGWPLVWDENEETAIQSPSGGTKVAWGGPPVEPKHDRNRQRFELALVDGEPGGDLEVEVRRLSELGANRIGNAGDGAVELADPDGNEFVLLPG